jgi:hypothetical protein
VQFCFYSDCQSKFDWSDELVYADFELANEGDKMGKNQHVVKRSEGWAVLGAGNSKDTSHHRTQEHARQAAREIAKNQRSEVVIHRLNGQIRDKDSYGNDPHPPKG